MSTFRRGKYTSACIPEGRDHVSHLRCCLLRQCHGHSTNSRKIRACQPEGGYVSISLPRCLVSPWDIHMNHSLASSRSPSTFALQPPSTALSETVRTQQAVLCSRAHPSCPGCWTRARAFDPIEHTVQTCHLPENLLLRFPPQQLSF